MIYAVIPAAGKSTRMGRPKLSLPINGRPVLEHVVVALRRAGVDKVVVVVGPHVAELAPLAEAAGAHALLLAQETPDMRATVEQGLRWLEEQFHPTPADSWLLIPADHPALDAEVVRALLRAAGPQSIVVPTYEGRRGHPVLIGWGHVKGMRALPAGQGLNVYLREKRVETLEVPVSTAAVLADLDTPEDYERFLRGTG